MFFVFNIRFGSLLCYATASKRYFAHTFWYNARSARFKEDIVHITFVPARGLDNITADKYH